MLDLEPPTRTATLAFAIQIYADFSAYSDIARGSARLLGIELMKNFDRPYLAEAARAIERLVAALVPIEPPS